MNRLQQCDRNLLLQVLELIAVIQFRAQACQAGFELAHNASLSRSTARFDVADSNSRSRWGRL